MSDRIAPKISKWPFLLGDLLLVGLGAWIVRHYPHPLGPWPLAGLIGCVALGAWLAVKPFLADFDAAMRFAETDSLTSAVTEINNVRQLANQISFATAQWQIVQEQSGKTVTAAHEIADRMSAEAKAFGEFMQQANDAEKAHLRLETDKLRRGEGEWLQIVVTLLDHVYALNQAGERAAQPAVREQLGRFQVACREVVRRLGLVPFEAVADELFDEKAHQIVDSETPPPAAARVAETLATGYTFQGQLLRRAIVTLAATPEDAPFQLAAEPKAGAERLTASVPSSPA